MNVGTSTCPKCDGEMVRGYISDRTRGGFVRNWFEGEPKRSFWSGTKGAPLPGVPVGTFRGSKCGFLESYARPEFAAE